MEDSKFKEPNFPKNFDSARKPLPASSPNSIPAHTEVKAVNGLPASTQPKAMPGWSK
jgi:hypothetical protein